MAQEKIVAVVGATGAQGGGLVRAIAADPSAGFRARALTRNPSSEKAEALSKLGVEVVRADVSNEDGLAKAFEGAHAAFCVTFFWEHFSPDQELANARAMARAAKGAGVQHAIWSTLEDTRRFVPLDDDRMPTLMERFKVPHFDAKGEADQVFRDAGVPTTFLLTSFYWDNLIHFGMAPKQAEDGRLVFALPMGDAKLPGIAAEDIGRCAFGVFRRGAELAGRTVGIAGEHLTGNEMATTLSEVLAREVVYRAMEPEDYRALGFPGADDLGNMFQFKRDFEAEFCGARDTALARELNPGLQTFAEWCADHAKALRAAVG